MTVEHEYCYAIAALDAEGGEATSECIGALVKVVPGVASVATNDGLTSSKDFFRVIALVRCSYGLLLADGTDGTMFA